MLILGLIFAVVAGAAYNAAAGLQKHEAIQVGPSLVRLLPRLARRRLWLLSNLVELLAWVAQTTSLALAPVAVVMPTMGLGTALLVLIGVRRLGERFRGGELAGLALVTAGTAVAAVAGAGTSVARAPLPVPVQLVVAAIALAVSVPLLATATGVGYGAAAGCLYAATTIYSKEVGDRFATRGWAAIPALLARPTPWLLIVLGILALVLVNAGFQRANAASVVAPLTAIDTAGPIVAGFLLFRERYPGGVAGVFLGISLAAAIGGMMALAAQTRMSLSPASVEA